MARESFLSCLAAHQLDDADFATALLLLYVYEIYAEKMG